MVLWPSIHRHYPEDSVGETNKQTAHRLGRKVGVGTQELEGEEWGGFDQNTLYACMTSSNNKKEITLLKKKILKIKPSCDIFLELSGSCSETDSIEYLSLSRIYSAIT